MGIELFSQTQAFSAMKMLLAVIITNLSSQTIKAFVNVFYKKRKFSYKMLLEFGGIPSSHSATVAALTTAIFLYNGFSPLFVLSLLFLVVIIRDAIGVRYELQKAIGAITKINKMLEAKGIKTGKEELPVLHELTGHSNIEVVAGLALGALIALAIYYI